MNWRSRVYKTARNDAAEGNYYPSQFAPGLQQEYYDEVYTDIHEEMEALNLHFFQNLLHN